jgi:transposase
MRPIPASLQNDIASCLVNSSKSYSAIASELGCCKATVHKVAKMVVSNRENLVGGRPKKLTAADERAILHQINSGKAETAVDVAKNLNTILSKPVSTQTVRNVLKKNKMKAVVKKKMPYLSPRHRKLWLEFALKYREWTPEDWGRVLFSDETKINRFGSDGRKWTWKQKGQCLLDREVQGTVKHGGGNIMVWGCMGREGVGRMAEVVGRMDAKQFVDILETNLLPSIKESGIPRGQVIFQQDNDPKHTSKLASQWFEDNKIELLDWPPQSPDLNPIEHLWEHLKRQLNARKEPIKGVFDLWDKAAEEWNKIDPEVCQNLIESIPRRLEAVIRAKGGHTKY